MTRTQVYLRMEQHVGLKREARRRGMSMTGLLRDLVERFLSGASRQRPNLGLVTALGRGKAPRASERHDEVFGRMARLEQP